MPEKMQLLMIFNYKYAKNGADGWRPRKGGFLHLILLTLILLTEFQ